MRKFQAIAAIVALIVVIIVLTSQRGGLSYFSPHSLRNHFQSERTILALGVPIYRSRPERVDNPLIEMLIAEGFVKPQAPPGHERKIGVFHWNETWRDGYGPLYDVLIRNRDAIIQWSRQNPQCAEIYWSESFRLLRSSNPVDSLAGQEILQRCWRIDDVNEMRETIKSLKADVAALMAQ